MMPASRGAVAAPADSMKYCTAAAVLRTSGKRHIVDGRGNVGRGEGDEERGDAEHNQEKELVLSRDAHGDPEHTAPMRTADEATSIRPRGVRRKKKSPSDPPTR